MDTFRVIKDTRSLLSNQDAWTRGSLARDAYSNWVDPFESSACKFCAAGALMRISGESYDGLRDAIAKLDEASKRLYKDAELNIETVNDTMGYEAVLKVFDTVIEELGNEVSS